MTDDEARTTSRSKTRGPCPVVGLYGYYTAFAASCKGYSHQIFDRSGRLRRRLFYDHQVFLLEIMGNLLSISPVLSKSFATEFTEDIEKYLKNKPLEDFSASLPLLLPSKALLNSHKTHIIHKRGCLLCVFCALCGHNQAILCPDL